MLYLYISLGIAAAAALVTAFVLFNNGCLKVTRYRVEVEGAPRLKIVHLSDLHGKRFGAKNARLIKKTAALKPDFIAVTGDVIHIYTQKNLEVAEELVSALTAIAPVLFVAGNHEMRNKGYRFLRARLAEAGAHILDDASEKVCGITVAGLNGASLRNDKIFKITPDVSPKILLAHEPQFFEKYARAGYDIVLCGHAHGGQWRIPFTGVGLYAPGQGKFPKYTSGVHKMRAADGGRACSMIVSRGLGNSEFPLRLFNRPEIVVTEINSETT